MRFTARFVFALLVMSPFFAAYFIAWGLIGTETFAKIMGPIGITGYLWLMFGVRWLRWRRRRRMGITNISFWSRKAFP